MFDQPRELWLRVHLLLALTVGLLFVVMGVSGSVSLFREELDGWFNPVLCIEVSGKAYLPMDKLMAAVETAHPERYGPWTLEMPLNPKRPVTAWYEHPAETRGKLYAPLMVSVNPYTAEVLASRLWGDTAVTWISDLHTQLHLGRFGWKLAGGVGLLLLVSLVSGLYLWWPGWQSLRTAVAIRHDLGLVRWLFDLHRLTGVTAATLLLILAFTGLNLAFPGFLEALAGSSSMAHGNAGPEVRSTAMPNEHPVGLAEAVLIARGPFPHAEVRRITTPAGEMGTYRINLRQRSEVNQRHPFTTVWVDRWSGQIREVNNPSRFSGLQTFAAWMWPLHTAEAIGYSSRLLWCLAGLAPLLLYVSGLFRFLHQRGWVRDRAVDFSAVRSGMNALNLCLVQNARRLRPITLRASVRLIGIVRKARHWILSWAKV